MTKDFGINMRPVNKVRVSIASLKDSFFEDHVLPSIFPLNSLITSWLSETQIMLLTKNDKKCSLIEVVCSIMAHHV